MRHAELLALFDYNYWANRQVLAAAAQLPEEELTRPASFTWRNLLDTLVLTLDVERSWRGRIRGEPQETWSASLTAADFPTFTDLVDRWRRDEEEMRTWIESLDDPELARIVDLGEKDRFPLWYFLLHIVTHSAQQRRDATLHLRRAGREPPELDFLYYADSRG